MQQGLLRRFDEYVYVVGENKVKSDIKLDCMEDSCLYCDRETSSKDGSEILRGLMRTINPMMKLFKSSQPKRPANPSIRLLNGI